MCQFKQCPHLWYKLRNKSGRFDKVWYGFDKVMTIFTCLLHSRGLTEANFLNYAYFTCHPNMATSKFRSKKSSTWTYIIFCIFGIHRYRSNSVQNLVKMTWTSFQLCNVLKSIYVFFKYTIHWKNPSLPTAKSIIEFSQFIQKD